MAHIGDYRGNVIAAEAHDRRSDEVWRFLRASSGTWHEGNGREIPAALVQFWNDREAIPDDVATCMQTWHPVAERGIKRLLFDNRSATEFIAAHLGDRHLEAFRLCHHPAMRADYFRLCYIHVAGGIYVDADDAFVGGDWRALLSRNSLKLQPLCYDQVTRAMIPSAEFIRDQAPRDQCTYYVNNNPLIAPARHPVVRAALDRATLRLLAHPTTFLDIQETTGPGNLTASLVRFILSGTGMPPVDLLFDWAAVARSEWPLSYRSDERNWRKWMDLIHQGLVHRPSHGPSDRQS